jgi:hypothetical protein
MTTIKTLSRNVQVDHMNEINDLIVARTEGCPQ